MNRLTILFAFMLAVPLPYLLNVPPAIPQDLSETPLAAQPHAAAAEAKAAAQPKGITTPKEHFGFNIGDDYCLANYTQLQSYWNKLAKQSDRLKLVEIGKTEEGRPQLMGIVTSPANHAKLEHYRQIAKRMVDAEGVSKEMAEKLAEEGKAVVWIDGGLHANEVLCAQMLMETMYQYLVATDAESLRILDEVIILFVHANPDGMELVADNYMKKQGGLGRLYQKYIGHDNNRDSFGNTQSETKNMNRIMFREWLPQIVFNHHQSGPQGTILFCPPFRDPHNYNVDPLVINGIDRVGAAIQERFLVENKPGATTRSGAPYSGWWNGGVRTTATFHNMIGLLTETVGSPTPMNIPLLPDKQLSKGDYLAPVKPQLWHFRQSVDYSVSSNKAVLDYASRNRRHLLFNIWRMGMNSIERGSRDSWTITPKIVAEAKKESGVKKGGGAAAEFERLFHKPAHRDPRGYILPANQPDFLTATKFINALMGTGVRVHRATADFTVAGKNYPKRSYIIKAAQAFRPHVIDMFEPQDHPDDIPYPGAAPKKPYDAAGWTMAFTMAVKFDRILDGFTGPFEEIMDIALPPPPGNVTNVQGAEGFFLDTRMNDTFRAVNQLHAAGHVVRRLQSPLNVKGVTQPAGTFFIPQSDKTVALLEKIAKDVGTSFVGTSIAPGDNAAIVKQPRIALWDAANGSMPSGWTRWIFEKMEFPFKVVKGNAALDKYDVLVLPDGGTWDAAAAKKFIENGGTVLAVGSATTKLGANLGLPLPQQVTQKGEKYYIPMSVLRVKMDNTNPLAWGMEEYTDVMFNNSPTFKVNPANADKYGMKTLAYFDTKTPLRSGWALGQEYLESGVAMVDVKMGKGRLALFGPQITFRAQPHGTFKLLFNGIVQAGTKE